MMIFDIFAFR